MMTIIIIVGIILIVAFLIFWRSRGIKHQIKYYTKTYRKLLDKGYSNEEAIQYLSNFYLGGEPHWKAEYMSSRYNKYLNNFDELIYDIMLFYYNIDPKYEVWRMDKGKTPVPEYFIIERANKYLEIYKKKYGIP
jgi:hypothetical protein